MGNDWFEFKEFRIDQPENVFRVGTDGVLIGAWAAAKQPEVRTILDVGTGTGLIALMMAQRFPGAVIKAIEPDRPSFEAAEANVVTSKWSTSVEVINSSLQEFASGYSGKFDLIVTNPPFFTGSLKNPDPAKASFRHAGALNTSMILEHSRGIMAEGGLLSLILPWAEGNVLVAEAAATGLYCSRMVKVRPFSNSPFNRVLLEFSCERTHPSVKILTVGHPSKGGYSRDYMELTGEFYLNF
ncbi:MAG: methyltransferase [Bacteroidales bacterium]